MIDLAGHVLDEVTGPPSDGAGIVSGDLERVVMAPSCNRSPITVATLPTPPSSAGASTRSRTVTSEVATVTRPVGTLRSTVERLAADERRTTDPVAADVASRSSAGELRTWTTAVLGWAARRPSTHAGETPRRDLLDHLLDGDLVLPVRRRSRRCS